MITKNEYKTLKQFYKANGPLVFDSNNTYMNVLLNDKYINLTLPPNPKFPYEEIDSPFGKTTNYMKAVITNKGRIIFEKTGEEKSRLWVPIIISIIAVSISLIALIESIFTTPPTP